MNRVNRLISTSLLLPLLACHATSTSAPVQVIADPSFLTQYAETYRFRLGHPSAIKVTPDGKTVLFLRSGPRDFIRNLYAFDVTSKQERVLITAESILQGAQETLSAEELARRERMRMTARGIASYQMSKDGKLLLVPLSGRLFVVERETAEVKELLSEAGFPIDPQFSPDGSKISCVREGDLYLIDIASGRETRLTIRDTPSIENGAAEFVAQEEMGRFHGNWWSPDGKMLAYQQTDTSALEQLQILDPMHPEKPARSWPYPRAGKKNAQVTLGLISTEGSGTTWVSWDRKRYPYLATVRWQADAPLTLVVQNRLQTSVAIMTVDTTTGEATTLFEEEDEAWLNIDQKMPRWIADKKLLLWSSDRHGTNQLELRNERGELLYAITPPELGYRELIDVNSEKGRVVVAASAEPTERHLYELSLYNLQRPHRKLSQEPGSHTAVYSKGHSTWVQTTQTLSDRRSFRIHTTGSETVSLLTSVAEEPPFEPNVELVRAGDREYRAAIVRPRNFEEGQQYPVIVHVYAGPRHSMVTAARSRYLLSQWFADHGFIVISLDGRGTPNRGREWERAIKNNFIDLPLEDQAEGLRALAKTYPEIDIERVGIFGWSFGGYFSAMATIRRGDLYRAGVAGAPVSEWLDYDTHYTERYMGLPTENAAGYTQSSVLTHVAQLERPLLILHGTADDNVYFMHSIKLSDALFRAGKPHGFLPLSGFTHMVPDPLVTTRLYNRIVGHFVEHLQ